MLLVAVAYTALAVIATWPLAIRMGTHITSDPGDPILNTSILVWNATTIPLSPAWYNAPHFYPTAGATGLTENLLGVYPIASPIYWLTHNPLLTYNLTLFLTWPLAAISVFLLVRHLVKRDDAAFLAGLAFAFTPYRAVALAHLQTLTTFGVPLLALGLHGYLRDRRWPWLVLAALAWLHQGFANGYYILYGALFVGLWVLYFCSTHDRWRAVPATAAALAIGSIPLVPMLLTYRRIHEELGLHRALHEILYFSATPQSWAQVGDLVWLWGKILPYGKDNMFPGLTAAVVVLLGLVALLRRPGLAPSGSRNGVRAALAIVVALAVASILAEFYYGPIDTLVFGRIPLKMRGLDRALVVIVLAGGALIGLTPRVREALARRSPFVFYTAGILVFGLLACGPDLRVGDRSILYPTPYTLLMWLPGFNELRVPTQTKMIHLLCLCVAMGIAYAALIRPRPAPEAGSTPGGRAGRLPLAPALAFVAVCGGILLDGWLVDTPMAVAQEMWPVAEPRDRPEPLLELPLGPDWDAGATLRAAVHHRRVVNGVSGYDPPYYYAIKEGLSRKDPALLNAFASLSTIDVVVDHSADPDGAYERYAASAPGVQKVADDGVRRVFRVPRTQGPRRLGPVLPIARMNASDNAQDAWWATDADPETGWGVFPQKPGQWVVADLGSVQEVGGITHTIGNFVMDFPRRLAIDLSTDGEQWQQVWLGPTYAETFLAFVRHPRNADLQFTFAPQPARFVRLRQLDAFERIWRLSELTIHAPAAE